VVICEHADEPSGSVEVEWLHQLNKYQLLKEDPEHSSDLHCMQFPLADNLPGPHVSLSSLCSRLAIHNSRICCKWSNTVKETLAYPFLHIADTFCCRQEHLPILLQPRLAL
jgi:hypothetical protein